MRDNAVLILALFVALFVTFAPAAALAKPKQARGASANATRLTPYVGLSGAGRSSIRGWGADHYAGRLGGQTGARIEAPLARYFSLGGMAEFGGTSVRYADRAELYLDFSLWAKGRYVFDFKPFDLEIYGGMPLGMSLGFVDFDRGYGREFGPGLNSGFLMGAQFLFKKGGFFTDLGPRFRRTWHRDGGADWSYGGVRFAWNFGGVLYF